MKFVSKRKLKDFCEDLQLINHQKTVHTEYLEWLVNREIQQNEQLKEENKRLKKEIRKLKIKKPSKLVSLGDLINTADFVKVRM